MTLGQIGTFLRSAREYEDLQSRKRIQEYWMGANFSKEGIESYLKKSPKSVIVKSEVPEEDRQADWKRLAAFFGGIK